MQKLECLGISAKFGADPYNLSSKIIFVLYRGIKGKKIRSFFRRAKLTSVISYPTFSTQIVFCEKFIFAQEPQENLNFVWNSQFSAIT